MDKKSKLNLSSNHSSTDYLDADEPTKYQHDNSFLTPSPSDITMLEAIPCDSNTAVTTTTSSSTPIDDDEEPLSDSVLQKNLQNSLSYSDNDHSRSPSIEEMELAREKFFRSIVNDSLNFGDSSSSSLLLQSNRIFSQIDSPVELPSSARARNELLAFEDTTESELATLCDNTYSEDREDVLSVTYEENSDDLNESVRNNKDYKDESSDKAEDTASSIRDGDIDPNESLSYDNPEDTDSQATKFEATNCEIDGKYRKSIVKLKKNGKKVDDDDDSLKSKEDDEEEEKDEEDDGSKIEEIETKKEEVKKEIKFEDDLSYIKKLRLVINKPTDDKNQRQLQGSLDSINLRERDAKISVPTAIIESMSKKSKSFESIKRIPHSFKPVTDHHTYYYDDRIKSDSTSQLVTAPEFLNTQTDEFCSACCYVATVNEQPSSVFYTMRSNCSSPVDEDSTECDICSSCNLRDSNDDALECKSVLQGQSLSETAEICEICGEPATSTPEPLTEDLKSSSISSRPFGLPKAKSTIEISRGSYRMSRADDDQFEIDNCGLQDCKLRASLDVCNKPEPLYVNVMPRYHLMASRHRPDQTYSETEYYYSTVAAHPDVKCIGPRDEIAMSRSLSIGGTKRLSRRGSYAKKSVGERTQDKRRFSSADNLQNRTSFRCGVEKFSKTRENKFMTSADSIRPPRVTRSRSLRRSADNVGRFDSSGDNLDSLEETADTDENGSGIVESDNKCTRVKIKDSDTIKMILTKHGIKIISQKETVL